MKIPCHVKDGRQWNELSEDEKNSLLMEAVENNQPYWMVASVKIED